MKSFKIPVGTILYRSGAVSGDRSAWFTDNAALAAEFGIVNAYTVKREVSLYKVGLDIEEILGIEEEADNEEIILAAVVKGYDGYVNDFEYSNGLDIGIFGPTKFLHLLNKI